MKKFYPLFLIVILLVGCKATPSLIPEGYTGEVVEIVDTYQRQSIGVANFYYAATIGNQKLDNAMRKSARYSQGQFLTFAGVGRKVTTTPQRIHLHGYTLYVVPLEGMLSSTDDHTVDGWVTFTPKANTDYLIKGSLSAAYSAVWIEDHHGNIVTDLVERTGPDAQAAKVAKALVFNQTHKQSQQSKQVAFANISPGASMPIVTKILQWPSTKIATFRTDNRHLTKKQYKGLGTLLFSGNAVDGYFVAKVQPMIGTTAEDLAEIKRHLTTDNGSALRRSTQNYYELYLNTTALDLFAQKLWQLRHEDHRRTVDAMGWICRLLAKDANGRYYDLLFKLSKQDNLSEWASESLKRLSKGDTVQFIPTDDAGV